MIPISLTRQQILSAVIAALQPLDYVYAMWEAGAAAFNRLDQWSDLDLMIDVQDEHTADAQAAFEAVIQQLSPIDLKYEEPQPTWHGHAQAFYRLQDASPFLMLDVVFLKHTNPNKFLEYEIHGQPLVYFDKSSVVQPAPFDPESHLEKLRKRLPELRTKFELYQILTEKEIQRGNHLEAFVFYMAFTLRPLVEVLRIRYVPQRYNFYTRYVYYELPADVVRDLEALYFIGDPQEIGSKRQQAEAWFYRTLDQLKETI
jgi:hypothetical protein